MTIIDGKNTLGGLNSTYYEKGSREAEIANALSTTIRATNTSAVMDSQKIAGFIRSLVKPVERVNGQPIPVEVYNVFFTEGGLYSDAQGFENYTSNFTMKRGRILDVQVINHTDEEILDARNKGINFMEKDYEDIDKVSELYVNRYIPYILLLTLITGNSLTTKIPTEATKSSDDNYTRSFGALRGEDVSDFIPATQGVTHECLYRGTKGATLNYTDITDMVDRIESFNDYSGLGVVAICHPRVLTDLGQLYKYVANQDKQVINEEVLPRFMGCSWLECTQMHKDFIIFVDGGQINKLIIQGINKDPLQRGFKLIEKGGAQGYNYANGLVDMKAVVFDEEYMLVGRQFVGILDISAQGKTESGKEGWITNASATKLETYAKLVESLYKKTK